MGHARAVVFAGSAGRWVAASWACCGPRAAPAGGEWRCVAGVYRFHGGGGAICSGVGWARGRLPAGSGCRGLTVGGSSAVSPWFVPWWSLVGWLKGVFGVYRIHGGTIVCWRAAAGGAVGCGGGACVGVVRVVGGGVSCVVLGGSTWWSVVVVNGGWSWAWRFLGGCGTCGVGLAGGGGCVGLRVCLLQSHRSLLLPFPCSSLFANDHRTSVRHSATHHLDAHQLLVHPRKSVGLADTRTLSPHIRKGEPLHLEDTTVHLGVTQATRHHHITL